MALAAGDRVRLFKSTGARFPDGRGGNIGRNGSVLEVVALDDKGMTARSMKTGREGWIAWASLADKAGRIQLAYGDVQTIHTSQGMHELPSTSWHFQAAASRSTACRLLRRHASSPAILPRRAGGVRADGGQPAPAAQ